MLTALNTEKMKQEVKDSAVVTQCCGQYSDEIIHKSSSDQPMDLRVDSAIEREKSVYNSESVKTERKKENLILATLLQINNTRSSTVAQKYSSIKHPYSKDSRYLPTEYQCSLSTERFYTVSNYYKTHSIETFPSNIKRLNSPSTKDIHGRYQYDKASIPPHAHKNVYDSSPPSNVDDLIIVFDSNQESRSAFRKITKTHNVCSESQPDKEILPNYRKFYSRCYDQAQASKSQTESTSTKPFKSAFQNCVNIRTRLSNSPAVNDSSLRAALDAPVSFTYEQLRRPHQSGTGQLDEKVQCLKRKLSFLSSDHHMDDAKKDKTIKCLLATSADEKLKHVEQLVLKSDPDKKYACEFTKDRMHIQTYWEARKEDAIHRQSRLLCRGDNNDKPTHIFYPQPVRPTQDDSVLKGLLGSDSKLPSQILPASGPPSSGSPGSESTSSGSTDSGVFSDNTPDERRKVTRVLSGRHVKSGTGASLTTLRLLRQMILERRKKNDRKL